MWIKLTSEWDGIVTFRGMGMLGLESATTKLHASNVQFVQHELVSGDFKHLSKNPDAFVREGHDRTLIKAITESAVGSFEEPLDSAALVFAHSILDSAVHDCLWISAFSAPRDSISLSVIEAFLFSKLRQSLLLRYKSSPCRGELDRLERESLLKKVDHLFQSRKPN